MPRHKLTSAGIAGILDECVTFAQANAATLAARDGTAAFSSLRQHHSNDELLFYQFVHKHQSRFTEAHRRRLADAFAHVEQARAAAVDPAAPSAPRADSAARKRPRRDADGVATCTNAAAHDDDLLCDWIDALAWLETAAATD